MEVFDNLTLYNTSLELALTKSILRNRPKPHRPATHDDTRTTRRPKTTTRFEHTEFQCSSQSVMH